MTNPNSIKLFSISKIIYDICSLNFKTTEDKLFRMLVCYSAHDLISFVYYLLAFFIIIFWLHFVYTISAHVLKVVAAKQLIITILPSPTSTNMLRGTVSLLFFFCGAWLNLNVIDIPVFGILRFCVFLFLWFLERFYS